MAVAIADVTYMGTASAFKYITKAVGGPRSRVIAVNLVKEKLETLKQVVHRELHPDSRWRQKEKSMAGQRVCALGPCGFFQ